MLLNYQYDQATTSDNGSPTLVLIHGLFGSLSNLGMIARAFQEKFNILQVDVRNHGHSAHADDMNYESMATDVLETIDHLNIQQFIVIGHSMGGKIAMKLADLAPTRLQKLIVLDMTPFAYKENHHDQIFKALFAVEEAQVESRKDATEIMRQYLKEEMVIQFLLKSWSKGKWLFNVQVLFKDYPTILGWTDQSVNAVPTLFIRGGNSPYLSKPEHFEAIDKQFSNHQIQVVENAGHWLHAEKPTEVNELILAFIEA
ncbi:alpha/beta fold hydrolase [uncultured Acinetobacter sp.]|uniref:alpha/beta fold hydrolase n=1 Tax=uncultured Acinetobacter sp. TaxID=165433 RepID=UPI0025F12B42|nr:alpha/beta fold hydrolase [uncultured Acinetobacter sp.]